jgi:hypothetical protein
MLPRNRLVSKGKRSQPHSFQQDRPCCLGVSLGSLSLHRLVSSEKDMNQEHRGLSRGKMLDRFKSPVSLMLRLCSVIDSSAGTLPPFASKGG